MMKTLMIAAVLGLGTAARAEVSCQLPDQTSYTVTPEDYQAVGLQPDGAISDPQLLCKTRALVHAAFRGPLTTAWEFSPAFENAREKIKVNRELDDLIKREFAQNGVPIG